MKRNVIFISLFVLIALAGCRTEKPITSNTNGTFFPQEKMQKAPIGLYANSQSEKAQLLLELKKYDIPISNPKSVYPTWESYIEMVKTKEANISPLTRQYCSQQFLASYPDANIKSGSKLILAIKNELIYLTKNEFRGYQLLYNNLLLLKQDGDQEFVKAAKEDILQYARPVVGAPKKDHPDDPRILQNETLRKSLSNMIAQMEKNDSYIERIKML